MIEKVSELLIELDKYWNASSDPRYKGEHPRCLELEGEIQAIMAKMGEKDIRSILDGLPEGQIGQITFILEQLVDDKPFLGEYI